MTDKFKEQMKRAQKRAEEFEFKKDNVIIGIYLQTREIIVKGKPRPMLLVRSDEDGKIYGIWGTKVLLDEFEKAQVKPRDKIGIKYLGRVKDKDYHDWIVIRDDNQDKNKSV